MTVREWFRLQRGAFWDRDPRSASDIDAIANLITWGGLPTRWVRIGSLHWIESVREYQERERVFELVRRDMEEAMRRRYLQGITE